LHNGNKRLLSEQDLAAIIQHAFGQALASSTELTDGWANSAYLVRMRDGREVVVKAAPPDSVVLMDYERGLMETEVSVLRLVKQTGLVPVPEVYIYDVTQTFVDCDYFIMEKLAGEPYNKVKNEYTDEQRAAIERKLGSYNRQINEIKGEQFGLYAPSLEKFATWKAAFSRLMAGVLADGERAGVQLPVSYPAIRAAVAARVDALDEVHEPRLVHWDLWDGNVFVHAGEITGIIDFERALWGDPLIENYFSHFYQSSAFREGYGADAERSQGEHERRALYDLYMDLIMYIECAYREYEDKEHIEWAREIVEQGWSRFVGADG
jgi:aminoglycoside phosphotransferase (APT) family kinase protein